MPVYLAVNLCPRIPFKNSYRLYEEKLISSLNRRKNRVQEIDNQRMILVEVFPQNSTFLLDKNRLFVMEEGWIFVSVLVRNMAAIGVPGRLVAECEGRNLRLLFKKIGEMGDLLKSKRIGDLGDIPVGLAEEDLCFVQDAAGYEGGGCFAGVLFEHFVEVVDVDGKAVRIVFWGTEAEALSGRFDGKLAFEQFDEEGADAGAGVVGGI